MTAPDVRTLTVTGCSACGRTHTVTVTVPGSFPCPTNGITVFVVPDGAHGDSPDARRRAEEALARCGTRCFHLEMPGCFGNLCVACDSDWIELANALRALLAATPPKPFTAERAALETIWLRLRTAHHVTVRIDGRDEDGGWIAALAREALDAEPAPTDTAIHPLLRTPTAGQDLTRSLFPPPEWPSLASRGGAK